MCCRGSRVMERWRLIAGASAHCLALTALLGACTVPTTTYIRPQVSVDKARAEFGTLGVAVVERTPELVSDRPETRGTAAKEGALLGFVGPPVLLGGMHPFGVFVGLAISPLSTSVGAIYGALAGKSPGEVREALSILETATQQAGIQQRLRDLVVARLSREDLSGVAVTDPTTVSAGNDTTLEIEISVVSLASDRKGFNPKLTLSLPCAMRIHRKGVEVVEVRNPLFSGYEEGQTLLEWAADDAKAFKEGITHELGRLAEAIVSELYKQPAPDMLLPPTPQPPEGSSCPANSVWNGYSCTVAPR